ARESEASWFFGRPRCEQSATAAPRSMSERMVGRAAVMRVSSATFPFSRGTLKSTRTRTFFPDGSTSRIVRFAKPVNALSGSGRRLRVARWGARRGRAQLRGDELRDIGEAACVTPLVVVPGDDLDHVPED